MSEQATVQVKMWGGPALGFIGGMVKTVIQLGLALETFVYGAISAVGVLLVQETYKYIKNKLTKNK